MHAIASSDNARHPRQFFRIAGAALAILLGVAGAQAERHPDGIKQPCTRPDAEVLERRVTVKLMKKTYQQPDTEQRDQQRRPQAFLRQGHVVEFHPSLPSAGTTET